MDTEDAARELYGLDLDDFVARRNELSKQARRDGDRDGATRMAALRKPSVAAWALNQLGRSHGGELDRLAAVASTLRDAQHAGDAASLRESSKEGQRLVRSLVAAAAATASARGRSLAAGALTEIEQSLRDALGDDGVLAAIRAGDLVDAPRSAGLGAFGIDRGGDPTDARAAFGLGAGPAAAEGTERQKADDDRARRRALAQATARLEAVRADHARAEADLDALEHELGDLDDARARLAEQLEALDARRASVGERRRRLEERTGRLAAELAAATRELEDLGGR